MVKSPKPSLEDRSEAAFFGGNGKLYAQLPIIQLSIKVFNALIINRKIDDCWRLIARKFTLNARTLEK